MSSVFWFLIETAGSLLASACLLRALAWYVRLAPHNQVNQFLAAATDWLVRPLRKMLPAGRAFDSASVVAAALVSCATALTWGLMFPGLAQVGLMNLLLIAAYWLCKWGLYLLIGIVILQAVLSWVNPHAPIAPALDQLSSPFLSPLRRVIPLLGGVDLSPLVLLIVAQLLLGGLEQLFFPALGLR